MTTTPCAAPICQSLDSPLISAQQTVRPTEQGGGGTEYSTSGNDETFWPSIREGPQ
jgi:hypothetical protein